MPDSIHVVKQHSGTIALKVEGGREKSPVQIPQISNETLLEALRTSILQSKLFADIAPTGQDYDLDLYIVRTSQPLAGNDMTVDVEIAWTLRRSASHDIIWRESITTSNTVTRVEEGNALNRVVAATNRAAKQNINEGILRISQLEF